MLFRSVFDAIDYDSLKNAQIAAFGCTRKPNIDEKDDTVLNMLVKSKAKIITIFGKSWDFQVTEALNTTLEENLNMIKGSIAFLIENGKEVFFDCEHFFDGYKSNPDYAILVAKTAHQAGAKRIILCDTNGGCINNEIYKITKAVVDAIPSALIGIHAHNDSDLAIANSIASVDAGANHVHGCINGYGERCGNTNICSLIPNLQLKRGFEVIGDKISKLYDTARQIAEISNKSLNASMPYVGRSAFAHKAGVHADRKSVV